MIPAQRRDIREQGIVDLSVSKRSGRPSRAAGFIRACALLLTADERSGALVLPEPGEEFMKTATMKAAVIHEAGGPEVLKLESLPLPTPKRAKVLIRVKAFGLNRSELFTRQGHSPGVTFPRVLGIEAVGLVEEAPGNEFRQGDIVASVMGGMGRDFNGGYAEYTVVPATHAQAIKTELTWETLGAIPEMLQTAVLAASVPLVSDRFNPSSPIHHVSRLNVATEPTAGPLPNRPFASTAVVDSRRKTTIRYE
jgi:hypothetical protein